MRDLFLRDGAGLRHRQTAAQVVLRLGQIGLALGHLGAILVVVGIEAAHAAHRLRQVRLGRLQRNRRVGGIELDQRLADADRLRVVRVHGDHGAGDLRRDLHHVAVHVGVVGFLVETRDQEVVEAIGDRRDHDREDQQRHHALALAVLRGGCRGLLLGFAHREVLRRGPCLSQRA
ncbi:hypothetical protein [Burkholderia gladioli]|uniref:hypothetical protein n=1 Tax=Burkholderia gladioli TaxID=28095 RepID=UPI003D20238C